MEKAISLTPQYLPLLRPAAIRRYDRIYLGSEFCPHLIPSETEAAGLLARGCRGLTLLGALMNGAQLRKFDKLVRATLARAARLEVSTCDLGLLNLLSRKYGGRLDFLLARPGSDAFLRMAPRFLAGFMRRFNVKYFETDEADMVAKLPPQWPAKISFHYPLRRLSVTRACVYEERTEDGCGRSCGTLVETLRPKNGAAALTLRNNVYSEIIPPCRLSPVARLVYTPISPGDRHLVR